jgi:hypothetical protein
MVRKAFMPMTGGTIRVGTMKHINGKGFGAVLLDKGGAGGGSSYTGVDDYFNTTGINPFLQNNTFGAGLGRSREKVHSKLESLLVKSNKGKKEKNINFNL